ncbi:MAG: putative aminopeptidase, partial [Proteobacteria bacterium]|nr:putative aminopeptidase [Pseudomonadota bacterium]
ADFPATLQAPAVFAGYGLTIPEMNYDDLAGLDLKGKIVVFLRGGPASIPGALRSHYQTLRERWVFLHRAGAVGVAAILDPQAMEMPWERYSAACLQPFMSIADPKLEEAPGLQLALVINPVRADRFFEGTGHTIGEILDLAHGGKTLPKFPLAYSIRASLDVERTEATSDNAAALLPGRDPRLRDEYVVISAHLDHLGVGAPIQGDAVYHGAMDDASGVASLFEIARTMKASPPRRSVLFVAVTGEEKGLLGSQYFAAHPTVKPEAMVADLNLDMFLPLYPLRLLTVYGLDESSLGRDVRAVARAYAVGVQPDLQPERSIFIRSDQYSFIRAGIPSLLFGFGNVKGSREERLEREWLSNRYHSPADNAAQPVDLAAAARFNRLVAALATRVGNQAQRPQWNQSSFFRRFAR